jgi:hypothetical protein
MISSSSLATCSRACSWERSSESRLTRSSRGRSASPAKPRRDHPGTDGPILVYDFDGAPSLAYTECNGGGRIVESPDEVGDLTMIVNMIRAAAMPRRESASLILKIRSGRPMSEQAWLKSSYSGSQANCVEVAVRDRVLVRDTKDRSGPVLQFTSVAWREFAGQVKAGMRIA